MTSAEAAVSWSGRHAVVTMPAEIDLGNSAELGDLLAAVIDQDPDTITADLTGTMFCDSAGVHAILQARRRPRARGAELRLAVGESPVTRVLELTGLDQLIPFYRDVRQSLDGSRTGHDSENDA